MSVQRYVFHVPHFIPDGIQGVDLDARSAYFPSAAPGYRSTNTHTNEIRSSILATKYGSAEPTTSIFGRPVAPIN